MPARFDRVVPHQDFWRKFVAQTNIPDAGRRFFHVLRIGDTPQSADEAAGLILGGSKTANVGLKLDYDESGDALPEEGMLSIVEDGAGHPVAIVETTEVVVEKFCEVDDAFARCFGDWGGSLKSWRRQCRANYAARCRSLGQPFSEDTELILERFRVVFKPGASAAPRPGR
ncbi:MAG: ASCH domain-containing protein [Acidisphaera sp.]|nr:ASCH domain-containing protein [Acidisphaera sp.]